jgi:hypothetical protein
VSSVIKIGVTLSVHRALSGQRVRTAIFVVNLTGYRVEGAVRSVLINVGQYVNPNFPQRWVAFYNEAFVQARIVVVHVILSLVLPASGK